MRRLVLVIAALALAAPPAAFGWGSTFSRVKGNPADALLDVPIDPLAYDYARKCRKTPTPGAPALVAWLEETRPRGESWGINRCERLSGRNYSLHAEGRAVDWHLDAGDRADAREAKRLITLLLAPDKAGNVHALARRMGVQEIIWDCRGWFGGEGGLRPYSPCYSASGRKRRSVDRTTAHRDHIHFGLSRRGAAKRTSFWRHGSKRPRPEREEAGGRGEEEPPAPKNAAAPRRDSGGSAAPAGSDGAGGTAAPPSTSH